MMMQGMPPQMPAGQPGQMMPPQGMPPMGTVMPEMGMPPKVYDISLRIKRKHGQVQIQAVPCEEVRVSKKCRGSLQTASFVEHVPSKTRSDLIEMGMPRSFVDELPAFNSRDNNTEKLARDSVTDETATLGTSVNDRSMDEIEFCEAYLRVDYDGDGVAELRKVVTCANQIPPGADWNEEIEAIPMTGFVAKRIPHRHVGESLDDDLDDLQEILTVLKRQLLDNIYLTNNSEIVVNERANLKDFTTRTPGGVKRTKGTDPVGGAFQPLVVPSIIGDVLPVIQFYQQAKEDRSGISRAGQGLDPDVIAQATKGAYLENLNRLSQKIEMMTRLLAEGVKEMVLQVHGLLIRHQDKPRMVQLRGAWVNVNPQEWKDRTDLTVRVGLGTGNEEDRRQKLMLAAQMQDRVGPHGLVGPKQMYALTEDLFEALGFDIPEKYVLSPESQEFQQMEQQRKSQPDPKMAIEQMKVQASSQAEQAKLQQQGQLEAHRMQMQAQVDQHRQQVEAQQQQAKMSMERELGQFKAQLASELEMQKMQLQQQTQVAIARINAQSKIDAAQVTAQSTLTPEQEAAAHGAVDA